MERSANRSALGFAVGDSTRAGFVAADEIEVLSTFPLESSSSCSSTSASWRRARLAAAEAPRLETRRGWGLLPFGETVNILVVFEDIFGVCSLVFELRCALCTLLLGHTAADAQEYFELVTATFAEGAAVGVAADTADLLLLLRDLLAFALGTAGLGD